MDADQLLDPEIRAVLAELPPYTTVTLERLPAIRKARLGLIMAQTLSDEVERTTVTIPGAEGAPELTLRIHRPKGNSEILPAIYWMHGGGYVLGAADMDDARFDGWCRRLQCVAVSVEYRLAPETPYPGPMDDCYAGLRWVHDHAGELRIDPARLGIGGPSAGGGLAAGLGLLARDRAEVPLAFQCLIYPMIDDTLSTVSSQWHVPIWDPPSNEFGWASYLGPLVGGDVPPYAAAARATDVSGLPPTFLCVGTLDGFFDEDLVYAQRLNHAGVPVELHVYPGAPHGFDGFMPNTTVARTARRQTEDWLARQFRA